MFLAQTFAEKELVIFNTAEIPLVLGKTLEEDPQVRLVNQSTTATRKPFTSLGEVRNAAIDHADGDLFVCWDDDDLFLPHHLEQSFERWSACGSMAWKPERSLFSSDGGKSFRYASNSMEASILVDMTFVRLHGFSTEQSGAEHVQGAWLDVAKRENQLTIESVTPLESYGYVWGDGLAKTSGNIDHPDNFENHKKASQDFGEGIPLEPIAFEELLPMIEAAQAVGKSS